MFNASSDDTLAASEHQMPNAQDRQQSTEEITLNGTSDRQQGAASLQPGDVVPDKQSNGLGNRDTLSARSCEPRVLPKEREVFERICKGHVAILELSL